jgi:hypothetical protein
MNRSFRLGLALLAATSMVALAVAGGAAAGKEYEPFVTDFPKAATPVEPYRPFATDFGIAPRPAGGTVTLEAKAAQGSTGRAWGDVALGGGLGVAVAVLVAAAALAVRSPRLRGDRHHSSLEPHAAPPR